MVEVVKYLADSIVMVEELNVLRTRITAADSTVNVPRPDSTHDNITATTNVTQR